MWKRILLVLVLALPLAAQEVNSTKLKDQTIENSFEDFDTRLEEIEIRWQDIEEKADDSGRWARWLTGFGIGLAALFIAFLVIFTLVSVGRVKKDLKEVKEKKKQIDQDLEEVLSKKEQVDAFLNSLEKKEETIVKELKGLREERERLKREGKNLEEIDKKYNDLLQRFNTLSEIGIPLSASGWLEKGNEYSYKSNFEDSLKAYDEAIKLKPGYHAAYYNKGVSLAKLGRYDEAIEAYDESIRLKQDFYLAHFNKGYVLDELGRYDEAIEAYDEGIRLKPDDQEAHFNKGNALCNLSRYDEAIEAYDEVIRLKPDYYYAHDNKAVAFLRWGATLKGEEAKEKFRQAKLCAEKAIKNSNGTKGYYNLACAQARLGELDEALESLKKSKENEEVITVDPWQDEDLEALREGEYRARFKEIVGPPPEGIKES